MHDYGDEHDDPTDPGTPDAIRTAAAVQFAICVAHVSRAVALLPETEGSQREYFAARLAEDLAELLAKQGAGLVELIRFAGPK